VRAGSRAAATIQYDDAGLGTSCLTNDALARP
jgi:hypothetical protein